MAVEAQQRGQFGEFRIICRIGEGPRAVVYKAEKGGRACALKILKESVLPRSASHRRRLAQILAGLAKLDNPCVVRVLEGGERDGRLYVATELMQCPTLTQHIAAQERLSEKEITVLARQIGQALEAARTLNLYHGDLVPENIYVPAPNKVKVSDFAIKRYISDLPRDIDLPEGRKPAVQQEGQEEWSSAEDLLRNRSQGIGKDQQMDLVALGALMMKMAGIKLPEQEPEELLRRYCERLRESIYQLRMPPIQLSSLAVDIITRLLSPGAFRSPGEVVVEIASTMALQRMGCGATAASEQEVTQSFDVSSAPREALQKPLPPDPSESTTVQPNPLPGSDEVAAEPATRLLTLSSAAQNDEATPFFVWQGESRGEFFILREGEELALGRDPGQCQFVIADGTISRRHCIVSKKNHALVLTDIGSANGTYVNDRRVQTVQLSAGDVIRIGSCRVSVAVPRVEK